MIYHGQPERRRLTVAERRARARYRRELRLAFRNAGVFLLATGAGFALLMLAEWVLSP